MLQQSWKPACNHSATRFVISPNPVPAAVRMAMDQSPDLVLMDILLEGDMNGVEAAELIHNQADIPIIFVTCLSDQALLERAVKANAYGYILKPYDNAGIALHHRNRPDQIPGRQRARERLIVDLEKALKEVKRLSGLLPICASCKKST